MSRHTVPTTAPAPQDPSRVVGPPCKPLGHPTPGNVPANVRAYVYARDALTCQECGAGPLPRYGDLIDGPHGPVVTRRYATLDHVIERRDGGCHHAHNLRVLCQTCNPRLGNLGGRP